MKHRAIAPLAAVLLLGGVAAACGDDDDTTTVTVPTVPTNTDDAATAATELSESLDTIADNTVLSDEANDRLDEAAQALQRGDFSTMLTALQLSGLGDEIGDRQVTVLAPNDAAFQQLSSDDMSDLLTNPSRIADVLRRHIIEGSHSFEDLAAMTSVTTISGETLSVTSTGDALSVDGATVTRVADDAERAEGQDVMVFQIDRVLLGS